MILDDVAAYLVANIGGSLSLGSTGNVFKVPMPESAPNGSIAIVEYGGSPSLRAMGANAGAPIAEVVRAQIMVRDVLANFLTARTLAQTITNTLDHVNNTTLASGGPRYLSVKALSQPVYIGEDSQGRHRFVCNFELMKERG